MALVSCPDCGKEISSLAPVCPSCGRPQTSEPAAPSPAPQQKMGFAQGCGLVFVCLLGLFLIGGALSQCGKADPHPNASSSGVPDLKAHISLNSGVILEVTNEDEFDWNNCRLTLNLQIFGRDYELSLARIAAHEHVSLPLDNFASGDGERFDPFTHKLKETAIVCETLGGKAFYTGSFEHKDGS